MRNAVLYSAICLSLAHTHRATHHQERSHALALLRDPFGFVVLGWTTASVVCRWRMLRLESFSLFVDGATFPMQGNHGLWRSRSICLKLKNCLPILEFADLGVQITFCRQALPGRGDWLSRLCSRVFGGVDSRVAGTSWACTFASQSIPLIVCSFSPRLLSKMELLSASDSCRAICLCSLGKGAREQVFAGVDGSERSITRCTTSPRSPFSFGRPWDPRSGDHECGTTTKHRI